MLEIIQQLSLYSPIIIFTASILDIFFATGLFLYGFTTLGVVAFMHNTSAISFQAIIISAYIGTIFGNTVNFFVGKLFGKTNLIKKRLENKKLIKAKKFLQNKGLFIYIIVCRFIAVLRPLYALFLGTIGIKFKRFILYESIIALVWVVFWLFILIQGENIFSYFLNNKL